MKSALFLVFLFLFSIAHSVTVQSIQFLGNDLSEEAMLLYYYPEFEEGQVLTESELDAGLERYQERLIRTGYFRDVAVTRDIVSNQAFISVKIKEKVPYSFWAGNFFIGISKYNLWGKGKTVKFEVGPVRQKIILEDLMFDYSPFSYSIALGKEELYYYSYITNTYSQNLAVKKLIALNLGYRILPDTIISASSRNYWLDETNGGKLDSYYLEGIKLEYDRRAGFPAVYKGFYGMTSLHYIFPYNALQWEASASAYWPFVKSFVLAGRVHGGVISGDVPVYAGFNLRDSEGLRTLSHFPGLLGNACWDAHAELRWAFWDVIPFFIFDMQLEALGFADVGEARRSVADFGSPHLVYGGGLRIYLDTFCVRAEAGVDETANISVITSFTVPF